ncbi:hypothetical protein ACFQ3W_13490 [Paenibacillus puldeungensis]|uniref:Uncharacterized protein n=1 Tax=Paenibacillus puldeungensis TaxID=696536 RepID=A0ABW3RZY4_9BACL
MTTADAFRYLTAASHVDKACWLNYYTNAQTYEECFHVSGEQLVIVKSLNGASPDRMTIGINMVQQICKSLAGRMKLNARTPEGLPALMMSKNQFQHIVRQSEYMDLEQLTTSLSEMTDDVESTIALARCLKKPMAHGEIRLFTRTKGGWDVQNAQFMNNDHMNWLIRFSAKTDEDWLIATPTPKAKFLEMLQLWLMQPAESWTKDNKMVSFHL